MEDTQIIRMYELRNEDAVLETSMKYQNYCYKIAWNILMNHEDSEECVNDTWLSVWNCIPPKRPAVLSAFCGKITRNLALDLLRKKNASKRGNPYLEAVETELDEIGELPGESAEDVVLQRELLRQVEGFLDGLPQMERVIFVRRYWYLDSIRTIAEHYGKTESSVKSILYRIRKKLKKEVRL
ncbi:MAG: sigma-70 family RNA polymerase sigma factor [Lachnospiraceae bacterium]|nr:sigma-70 family RNA polymerase sigma factor [Lachnospiraceae bacterium]